MENIRKAYSETLEILTLLKDEYTEPIPDKFIDFLKKEKHKSYKPYIDVNIPLSKQHIMKKTKCILAILNLRYWCITQYEKEEFMNKLNKRYY